MPNYSDSMDELLNCLHLVLLTSNAVVFVRKQGTSLFFSLTFFSLSKTNLSIEGCEVVIKESIVRT